MLTVSANDKKPVTVLGNITSTELFSSDTGTANSTSIDAAQEMQQQQQQFNQLLQQTQQTSTNMLGGIAGSIAGGVLVAMATKKKMKKHKVGRIALIVLGVGAGGAIGRRLV